MNWKEENGSIVKSYIFNNSYKEAVAFVNGVADLAIKLNHHPDILLTYHKVTITLSTHDAGHIVTDKDWKLAKAVDELFSSLIL